MAHRSAMNVGRGAACTNSRRRGLLPVVHGPDIRQCAAHLSAASAGEVRGIRAITTWKPEKNAQRFWSTQQSRLSRCSVQPDNSAHGCRASPTDTRDSILGTCRLFIVTSPMPSLTLPIGMRALRTSFDLRPREGRVMHTRSLGGGRRRAPEGRLSKAYEGAGVLEGVS